MYKKITALGLAVASLWVGTAVAATTLHFVDHNAVVSTVQVDKGVVRAEQGNAAGVYMLFEAATSVLSIVDPRQQAYQRITPERLREAEKNMAAAKAKLKENFDKMPADKQASMQPMLDKLLAEHAKMVKQTGKAEVAGIACQQHTVLVDAEPTQQLCSASADALGIAADEYQAIAEMLDVMADLSRIMAGVLGAASGPADVGGVPIETKDLSSGAFSRLQRVDAAAIAAERFIIPSDYQQAK